MSRYPTAQWRPIRDTSTVAVRKDLFCLHTMVGGMRGTWSYFDRLDVQVYSQLLLGGPWGSDAGHNLDGVAWQIADTDYRAAANLDGNWRIIALETADNAARPIKPWTPRQCDTIVDLMVDAHELDGIPLVLVPDSKIGRRGICYHRQGCDPFRVAGGERWSAAFGKDCPTDPRIAQIPTLIARARAVVAGGEPIREDLSIVDADTKTYLDGKFKALDARVGRVESAVITAIYGDSRTDLPTEPADTHPDNLQMLRRELGELRTLVDARLPEPAEPPA